MRYHSEVAWEEPVAGNASLLLGGKVRRTSSDDGLSGTYETAVRYIVALLKLDGNIFDLGLEGSMNKFFSISFLIVFGGYLLLIFTVGYVGVYVHYFAIPMVLVLLFLSVITWPGLIFGKKRARRHMDDDEYDAFDFILDCGEVIFAILKFPFALAKFIRDDYRDYRSSRDESEKDRK